MVEPLYSCKFVYRNTILHTQYRQISVDGTVHIAYGSVIEIELGNLRMKPMETYDVLRAAFNFFNKELFEDKLSEA